MCCLSLCGHLSRPCQSRQWSYRRGLYPGLLVSGLCFENAAPSSPVRVFCPAHLTLLSHKFPVPLDIDKHNNTHSFIAASKSRCVLLIHPLLRGRLPPGCDIMFARKSLTYVQCYHLLALFTVPPSLYDPGNDHSEDLGGS